MILSTLNLEIYSFNKYFLGTALRAGCTSLAHILMELMSLSSLPTEGAPGLYLFGEIKAICME